MQFTLVVTSTKTRKERTDAKDLRKCISCRLFWETELWVNIYILYLIFLFEIFILI
jgi:hypothetical protein